MKYLDLSLPTPEANLACDEALLDWCESGQSEEVLRFWQADRVFVVLGYANAVACEVNVSACQDCRTPVLRRCTGGGTVLQGPGCLNYSLVLRTSGAGPLMSISGTNQYIMTRHRDLVARLTGCPVEVRGHTDLAIQERKFSGNAQRRRREFLLFHGSFLLDFDLQLIETLLPPPSKQPDYRANRAHLQFLRNLSIPPAVLKDRLRAAWQASEPLGHWPSAATQQLVEQKYSRPEWNRKF